MAIIAITTSNSMRVKAETGDRKPETGERRAEGGERKPETGNRRAEGGERKPETGDRRAEGGERKPESGERRAETGDRKPEREEGVFGPTPCEPGTDGMVCGPPFFLLPSSFILFITFAVAFR
jgi:hypothetical protein